MSLNALRWWPPQLLAGLAVALTCAASAEAQVATHSLSGNARFQIGNGLPIPLTVTWPPNGRIMAIPGATVMQTTGPDPRQMTIAPSQLTVPAPTFSYGFPIFGANPAIFQVATALAMQLPRNTVTFRAGGRTGPPTVTWCPGRPLPTTSYNPGCLNPVNPTYPTTGRLRYRRTANQFGGPAQAAVQGTANIGLWAWGAPPCGTMTCNAIFALAPPAPTAAIGGPFGWWNYMPGVAPNPGLFDASVTTGGWIFNVANPQGPGLANPALSYGGPWTTGQIIVSAKITIGGGSETFIRTGSDARVSGVGTISLVAGAVSVRGRSGPNANRGWLNLTVPEPGMAVSAAGAFLLLAACHALVRRRAR